MTGHHRQFQADWFNSPANALLGLAKRKNIPIDCLADAVGGRDALRGLLKGSKSIDDEIAQSLEQRVGGTADFWLARQRNYDIALDRSTKAAKSELERWLSEVPSPYKRRGGRLSEVQREEEMRKRLAFYGVNNLRVWAMRYGRARKEARFRTSQTFTSEDGAVSLWLRQGEITAALAPTNKWNPQRLRDSLQDLIELSKVHQPIRFIPRLKSIAAEAGVAIVIARAPAGCRASGASRLIYPDRAMILLSFRHLSDDHFWFTLLHECGHLLLHSAKPFVDEDGMQLDQSEREANEFARGCIVPASKWKEFAELQPNKNAVMRFAVSLKVSPGLIVGQMQNAGAVPPDKLNFLKRRWSWPQIEAAQD